MGPTPPIPKALDGCLYRTFLLIACGIIALAIFGCLFAFCVWKSNWLRGMIG
jgi:hypothetical protein